MIDKTEYAFPQGKAVGTLAISEGWLTLRDYFAAKAMQSFLAISDSCDICEDDIASISYEMASAMICAKQDLEDLEERLKTIDDARKIDIDEL